MNSFFFRFRFLNELKANRRISFIFFICAQSLIDVSDKFQMDFGEPPPDVIARLYNEIKEKKVGQ